MERYRQQRKAQKKSKWWHPRHKRVIPHTIIWQTSALTHHHEGLPLRHRVPKHASKSWNFQVHKLKRCPKHFLLTDK
jgi:hypothetical protein